MKAKIAKIALQMVITVPPLMGRESDTNVHRQGYSYLLYFKVCKMSKIKRIKISQRAKSDVSKLLEMD